LKDLGKREVLILVSMVFFIILMGVYPKMFFKKMDTTVTEYLAFVKAKNAQYRTVQQNVAGTGIADMLTNLTKD
jgi:NADH:ubiquinone oxidoreductase subunit 4 (subunit M)